MKSLNIKNFYLPTFLLETMELEFDINILEKLYVQANEKLQLLKGLSETLDVINKVTQEFKKVIAKAYPKETNTPAIRLRLTELHIGNFESLENFKERLAEILFRIYFSEGADKVYDFENADFFDDEKCQKLFDQEIFISEEWLNQLIRCLIEKNAQEDMILHNFTPEWLWPKVFKMLLEIYELTKESITNKNGQTHG